MRFVDGQEEIDVERPHWTERAFDDLGWHDCRVHAIAFCASETDDPNDSSFALDVDYILRWVAPSDGGSYRFWVAPATLVFRDAQFLRGTLSADLEPFALDEISRTVTHIVDGHELDGLWDWTVSGHDFALSFTAAGFDQYLRAAPILTSRQTLTLAERGGISFERATAW